MTSPTPRPTPPTPPFPPPGPWGPTAQPSDLRTALAALGVLASWVPPAGAFYVFHLILDHFTGVTQ